MKKGKFLILIPILLVIIYGFFKEFVTLFKHVTYSNFLANGFYPAFLVSAIVAYLYVNQSSYFSILKHELIHNLFALLTGNKPHALVVKKGEGGEFSYSGDGNVLITLSPYFFPLLSFCWMPISLLSIKYKVCYSGVLGIFFGVDVATSIKDMHLKQTDFRHYGLFFSTIFIFFSILLCWGSIIAFAQTGFLGIATYFTHSTSNIVIAVKRLLLF